MKKKMHAVALVLSAVIFAQALPQQTQWVKVAPQGGRFSVSMPSAPDVTSETKESELGPYTSNLFLSKGAGAIYIVGWVDYSPGVKLDVQGEINANRDNFVKGVEAEIKSEKKITLNGHPGIEFVAESANSVFKARVYLANPRPYMLATAWAKGAPEPAGVGTFFDSFKFEGNAAQRN